MDAIYVSSSSFKVLGDRTTEFNTGRRVKSDCGLDGIKYASTISSSYSSPYTTVTIDESDLTASLTSAWYGVTQTGEIGSFPDHTHDGSEGSGGTIANTGVSEFINLTDTPTTYSGSEGLYLRVDSTASGIEFSAVSGTGSSDVQTLLDLTDTPDTYDDTKYLMSTSSGTVWSTVSGTGSSDVESFLDLTDTPNAYDDGKYLVATSSGLDWTTLSGVAGVDGQDGSDSNPIGTIIWFAADTPPSGYLTCSGGAVSRTTYSELFDIIGTTYGVGDGSTTFNLPDLRSEFIRGAGLDRGLDGDHDVGTSQDGTNHHALLKTSGAVNNLYFGRKFLNYPVAADNWEEVDTATSKMGFVTADGSADSSDYQSFRAVPRNIAMLPCIKYQISSLSLLDLTDTPTTYSGYGGLFLRIDSTESGIEFSSVSGIDDHTHTAYVPWDFGSGTISGTGDIYCNDIYTSSGTVYIGDLQLSTDGTRLLVDDQPIEAATPAFVDLTDTPDVYDDGKHLVSTSSGVSWTSTSGVPLHDHSEDTGEGGYINFDPGFIGSRPSNFNAYEVLLDYTHSGADIIDETITLDGELYDHILFEYEGGDTTTGGLSVRINGDTGTNYSYGLMYQNGSVVTGAGSIANALTLMTGSDTSGSSWLKLYTKKTGEFRGYFLNVARHDSADLDNIWYQRQGHWQNTGDAVTSLRIYSVNNINNARLKVYGLKQVVIPSDEHTVVGQQSIKVDYKDADEITLSKGVVHIDNGFDSKTFTLDTGFDKTLTSLANDTFYYIYVQPPTDGTNTLTATEFTYITTAPSLDADKQGWYHTVYTNRRCIGVILSDASGNITEFRIEGNHFSYLKGVATNIYFTNIGISTSPNAVDFSDSVPEIARKISITSSADTYNANVATYFSPNVSLSPGKILSYNHSSGRAQYSQWEIWCNDSLGGWIWEGAVTTNTFSVYVDGWYLPSNIYTGELSVMPRESYAKGTQGIKMVWKSDTQITLHPGTCHISTTIEKYLTLASSLDITPTSLTTSSWHYVYVDHANVSGFITSAGIEVNTSEPTLSEGMGWYLSGTYKRCIGAFWVNSTDDIEQFGLDNNEWRSSGDRIQRAPSESAITPSNIWQTVAFKAPFDNSSLIVRVSGAYVNATAGIVYRPYGSSIVNPTVSYGWVNSVTVSHAERFVLLLGGKSADFKWNDPTTNTIKLDVSGYVVPDLIFTGPIKAGGVTVIKERNNPQPAVRGMQSVTVKYLDDDTITIGVGSVHIQDSAGDVVYQVESDISFDMTAPALSNSTWYYIYVGRPSSGTTLTSSDFSYSTTAPTDSDVKQGMYHPTSTSLRCIGAIVTDATADITKFHLRNNEMMLGLHLQASGSTSPSNTWTDHTLSCPLWNGLTKVHFRGAYSNVRVNGSYRVNGTSDTGIFLFTSDDDATQSSVCKDVVSDSDGIIEVTWNNVSNNTLTTYVLGWILPDRIYNGPGSIVQESNVIPARGMQGLKMVHVDDENVTIQTGVVHIMGDGWEDHYELVSDLTVDLSAKITFGNNTWYYVYVSKPSSGYTLSDSDFYVSTTAPTRVASKGGQYDTSEDGYRCIGAVVTDGTADIMEFYNRGNTIHFSDFFADIDDDTPSNVYTDQSLTVPLWANGSALAVVYCAKVSDDGSAYYKMKGASDPGVYIMTINSACTLASQQHELLYDSNGYIQTKWSVVSTDNTIKIFTNGFKIPDDIYTGPMVSALSDGGDNSTFYEYTGKQKIVLEWVSSTSIKLKTGQINIGSGLYKVTSAQTKTGLSALTASTIYYVYVEPPSSGTTITDGEVNVVTQAPSYSESQMGWYHPTNTDWRCIGAIYIDASNLITEFYQTGNRVEIQRLFNETDDNTPSNVWTDQTLSVPLFEGSVILLVRGGYIDANVNLQIRTNGSNAEGLFVERVTSDVKFCTTSIHIRYDSSGIIETKFDLATTNLLDVFNCGWILPSEIYGA